MADYSQKLFDAVYGTAPAAKQAEVSSASAQKQRELNQLSGVDPYVAAAGRATGAGAETASAAEMVARTGDPSAIFNTFGAAGLNQFGQGVRNYERDTNAQRTVPQVVGDTAMDVGLGAANMLGGLGVLSAGFAHGPWGVQGAQALQEMNKWGQGVQSDELNAARTAQAARSTLSKRDDAAAAQADIDNGETPTIQGLKAIGRDFISGIKDAASDSATLGSGVAQGVGSMLAVGPVARLAGAAGSAIVAPAERAALSAAAAIDAAAGVSSAARVAAPVVEAAAKAGTPLTIGAMEAGGAMSQTINDVMSMTQAQLEKNSPEYKALKEQHPNASFEVLRRAVAIKAGQTAAKVAAPGAIAAGALVSRFEAAPLSARSLTQVPGNLARETVEEGLQGATGQFAQNVATQMTADSTKSLTDDIGRNVAEGALYGLGTAGAVQVPGVARRGLELGGKATDRALGFVQDSMDKAAAKRQAKNEASSPVADETIAAAAQGAVANAPDAKDLVGASVQASAMSQEDKVAAMQYTVDLMDAFGWDPSASEGAPDVVRNAVGDAEDRVSVALNLAEALANVNPGREMGQLAEALFSVLAPVQDLRNRANSQLLDQISDDRTAMAIVDEYEGLMANIDNTPRVKKALDMVQKHMDTLAAQVANPQTQEDVNQVAMIAALAPEKLTPEQGRVALKQAQDGKLVLTPEQRGSIMSAVNLMQAQIDNNEALKKVGLPSNTGLVSEQITTDETRQGINEKSAVQHSQGILAAMRAGNDVLASERLARFGQFVEHMNNKVAAFNEHFAAGDAKAPAVPYTALLNGKWKTSPKGVFVNTASEKSISTAQHAGLEASFLADVFNGLADAWPELGVAHIDAVPLAPELMAGEAAKLAADFRAAFKAQAQKPVVEKAPEVQEAPTTDVKPATQESVKQDEAPEPTPVKEAEPEPAPAPEVEAKGEPAVVEAVAEPADAVVEDPAPVDAMGAAFPDLRTFAGVNQFAKAFKLPSVAKSRIVGQKNFDSVVQALRSASDFAAMTGKKLTREFDGELSQAYIQYVKTVGNNLRKVITAQMADAMSDKPSKGSTLNIDDSEEANRFIRGKVLNLTTSEGNYAPELLMPAVLAGLQWNLTSNLRGAQMDESGAAKMLGVSEGEVSEDVMTFLENGLSIEEAIQSLSQKITDYWGVSANKDAATGYTKGIPAAMAQEVLRAMIHQGLVKRVEMNADGRDAEGNPQPRTLVRYVSTRLESDVADVKQTFAQAIDQLVMTEPEELLNIGTIPSVPKTQLRNELVPLTAQQKDAIKGDSETVYRPNTPVLSVYDAIGIAGLVDLFAAGDLEGRVLNKNHKATLEGKNMTMRAGAEHLQQVRGELAASGDAPLRYGYTFTSVNRMQMLGKHNPQSNKLVRNGLTATWSNLDLTAPADRTAFNLGLAQAFGIKVHNMSQAKASEKVLKGLRSETMAPVLDVIREAMEGQPVPPIALDMMKTAFKDVGFDLGPVGLHALVEYVRTEGMTDAELKAVETSLPLEADGATNGPINAMNLLTTGPFSTDWVKNVAKGGLFFGKQAKTLNMHRGEDGPNNDSVDLYEQTTQNLDGLVQQRRSEMAAIPGGVAQMNALLGLMSDFLPDLQMDEQGNLTMKRGMAKNPLTITIYGSGAAGIAGKVSSNLMEKIYEQMSAAAQRLVDNKGMSDAMAMFPSATEEEAAAKYARFDAALSLLTEKKVMQGKEGEYVGNVKRKNPLPRAQSFADFTLDAEQKRALQDNMLSLFVTPMRNAITATVGAPLMETVETLRQATQVQSIVLEDLFKAAMKRALEEKAKDPNWKPSDFLSQSELDGILDSLKAYHPLLNTGTQGFFIAGSSSSEVKASALSRALDDTMAVNNFVYGPADSGVSGIPYLVIGMGDGQMMQTLSTMDGAPQRTLKVFDGMEMPLDKIADYSVKANKAVYESWQGNPMRVIEESYTPFVTEAKGIQLTEEALTKLGRAFGLGKDETIGNVEAQQMIERLADRVAAAARSIDARHAVVNQVAVSVDQMAAASAPFQNGKKKDISGSPEEVAAALNELYAAELVKQGTKTVVPEVKVDYSAMLGELGRGHKTGVRVLSNTSLKTIRKAAGLSEAQAEVLGEALDSGALKGWKFVVGDRAQAVEYANFLGVHFDENDAGVTLPGAQTVLLANASNETLVHEAVHAATFMGVLNHYQGQGTAEVGIAVQNIEKLMDQFRDLREQAMNGNPELAESYQNALAAMDAWATNMDSDPALRKAGELNEFMAWSLGSTALGRLLDRNKASKLAQIGQKVLDYIKQIFWGKKAMPAQAESIFGALRFNTALVMRGQMTTAAVVSDAALFQSKIFGDDACMSEISAGFGKALAAYGDQHPLQRMQADTAAAQAAALSAQLGHDFPMNAQQQNTFMMVATALATEAQIDGSSMAAAAQLYEHVRTHLNAESFLNDSNKLDVAARAQSRAKYNAVMAFNGKEQLPVFLALAMTDESLRDVMRAMPLPAKADVSFTGVDELLNSTGTWAMNKLADRLAGQDNPATVTEALDQLMLHASDLAQDRQAYIDQIASHVQGFTGRANEILVESLDALGAKAEDLANVLGSKGRAGATAASVLNAAAALTSDERAGAAAEGIMSKLNDSEIWKPVRDLIGDLVGRTGTNAPVYDMIKKVRSAVSQARQNYREHLPSLIAGKFSRELSDKEWNSLYLGLAKTDFATLVADLGAEEARKLVQDPAAMTAAISAAEATVRQLDAKGAATRLEKAKQLAAYMNGGPAGVNLLRNASAIWDLVGVAQRGNADGITAIDKLVTLYAVESLAGDVKLAMGEVLNSEAAGIDFMSNYLVGQRAEELRKADGSPARYNALKGYTPSINDSGVSLVAADASEHADLLAKSYVKVGDYVGDANERGALKRAYYFAPVSARAAFSQGIMQNARETAGGVDMRTGLSFGTMTAGVIRDEAEVKRLALLQRRGVAGNENLVPVFDAAGDIVAFERSVDPAQLVQVAADQNLAQVIGNWRGRQVEEVMGMESNKALIDTLGEMYRQAKADGRGSEFVNLYKSKDPIIADAVKLLGKAERAQIEGIFGKGQFMVRKDQIDDVMGYRAASVGDAWTGNTRWNDKVQKVVQGVAMHFMGNDAYKNLLKAEGVLKNAVADAKTIIVVKSMVVPFFNAVSNVYQLLGRGVPLQNIARNTPKKLNEVNQFAKGKVQQIELEAELRAAVGNPAQERRLQRQIDALQDSFKRLSIWPLIEAGEFSAISDATISREEVQLSEGRIQAYVESLVDRLPEGVRKAGKYALITKDTALFQGLQKAVDYGDFLAKALIYDDLTQRKGLTKAEALARVTEEFVNYDRLPGRFRGGLESLGLLWFWNFKIRSTKVALSMLRNNPLHSLMEAMAPQPAGVGTPIQDNIFAAMMDGRLENSVGFGMGLRAPMLNPWLNLTN